MASTATISRIDVTSKAKTYVEKSERASLLMLGSVPLSVPPNDFSPVMARLLLPAPVSTAVPTRPMMARPMTTATGRCTLNGSTRRSSDRSTPSNMITNRKSTTMAPA